MQIHANSLRPVGATSSIVRRLHRRSSTGFKLAVQGGGCSLLETFEGELESTASLPSFPSLRSCRAAGRERAREKCELVRQLEARGRLEMRCAERRWRWSWHWSQWRPVNEFKGRFYCSPTRFPPPQAVSGRRGIAFTWRRLSTRPARKVGGKRKGARRFFVALRCNSSCTRPPTCDSPNKSGGGS